MSALLSLEEGAIAALAQLAATNAPDALRALDASSVQASDFADAELKAIWGAVEAHVRDGRVPDLYSVQQRVPKATRGRLMRLFVEDPSNTATWWQSAGQRLELVHEAGQRRSLLQGLKSAETLLADTAKPLAAAVEEARRVLESSGSSVRGVRTLDGDVIRLVDHLEEVAEGRRAPVLATGLEAWDAAIGGLQPTLTVIGALPAVGKSALVGSMVRNLASRGVTSGLLSLEDEGSMLVRRLVAEAASVPVFILANRPLGREQRKRVEDAVGHVHTLMARVLVDDRPGLTTDEVVASARSMLVRGAKAIFVDHLGEVRLKRTDRHDLDIIEVLQQLRGLAKTCTVPVVVLCHLKRRDGLEPKDEPRLTDFAFSAGIERMARVAVGLARPDEETLRVYLLKQTQGIAGKSIDLEFDGPSSLVRNTAAGDLRARVDARYDAQAGEASP